MKKQLILSIFFLVTLLSFSSCFFLGPSINGNGNVTVEYRDIRDFEKVKVSNGLNVILVQSDKDLVTVEADENLHEVIQTELKHGELKIFTDERIKESTKLVITVELKDIEELQSGSGAQVKTDGVLHVKNFMTKASSGSQQNLHLNVASLVAKTSSGAQMRLEGVTQDVDLSASSGAQLLAGKLVSKSCVADVSSGAHIYIEATEKLDGEASSGGNIFYSGNPTSLDISTSSGGNITKH